MHNTIINIWSIFTPSERRKSIWMLLLAILMAAFETIGVISILPFLSVLARPSFAEENIWLQGAFNYLNAQNHQTFILTLGISSILLVIGSSAFKIATQHILNRFVHMLRHSISNRLMRKYLNQQYDFFLRHNSAELSKSVLAEVDMLMGNMIQPISQIITQATIVLAMSTLVFVYNPLTAIAIITVVGLMYGTIYLLARKHLQYIGTEIQSVNKERYQTCNEALHGIRAIKISHSEESYAKRYESASYTQARYLSLTDTLSQTPLYLVEAIGYTGLITIALLLLSRSNDLAQVLPALGLYGFSAYRMLPAAQIIYRGFARCKFAHALLKNIEYGINLPETDQSKNNSRDILLQKKISLRNISYAYPSAPKKKILENFSIEINAFTSIGIVGKSGAGKSTVMDLLLGLIKPQNGDLYVDDVKITNQNIHEWHRIIGYVPQHIYLSDASIAENIALGIHSSEIDMDAVKRAADMAQLHDFILTELPLGYTTIVGDQGIRLSGGQRQRIGIARALYHDPSVIFMDEATSALDLDTEREIHRALNSLHRIKTIIIITHRSLSEYKFDKVINI